MAFDPNFACCGGCSSSKRADAYNDKLATGARVFIWDTKLKTDPAPVCLLTFPYDKALNEQEGDRRVRSGRLVGTSYPIDHDFDQLCCEQRGLCQALEEDASGKCQCVKKWGFTGDHCEHSVYDVATQNNTAVFPAHTNLTDVDRLLPDLRSYLVDFDMETALRRSRDAVTTNDNLLSVFQFGADEISYRQFAWSACAYVVLGAAFFVLLFLLQLVWSYCCFKCGCRKKDPRKQPRIYSKAAKIFWGVLTVTFLAAGAAAAALTYITVHSKLIPGRDALQAVLSVAIPSAATRFTTDFTGPIDQILEAKDSPGGFSLESLQEKALNTMRPLTFLDTQSLSEDVLGRPVFSVLDGLQNYSSLYSTVISPSIDCAKLNITPNVAVRMTIGATSGCFRCKTCSTLVTMVDDARDRWRRRAYKSQLDLRESREQLLEFGAARASLTPEITAFRHRLNTSNSLFLTRLDQIAAQFEQLSTEAQQLAVFGLFGLMGLCGLALALSLVAFGVGIKTNKRPMARTTCFVGEIAVVVALLLVGVIYSIAMMAHDGITALELLDQDVTVMIAAPSDIANDTLSWLWDRSFVDTTRMNKTLAFADTLRVPPHPTPSDDNPPRFDIADMYNLPFLFELETQLRDVVTARTAFFGWEQSFLDTQYEWLRVWAFANDTVVSPYNLTIHQTLLNSTTAVLLDPDEDENTFTDDDDSYMQSVFNESWRGVDDRGVAQNQLILSQWRFVAQLELQKQRLGQYCDAVADIIDSTKPLLEDLAAKTRELEAAEYALKAPVEFFTDRLRAAKLRDCSYDGRCAWLRTAVNTAFAELQDLITHAEFAALCCAAGALVLLLGTLCAGCFASRLRRNVVKVYVAS